MHTVEIWRETLKKEKKMRNVHCMTWNMARNTENGRKCEMYTV